MGIIKKILELVSGKNKSVIIVDGQRYEGNNLTIESDGTIIVDGEIKESNSKLLIINIESEEINKLNVDKGLVTVNGCVGNVTTKSGDVEIIGDVLGLVKTTSGDIDVEGNISGNVETTSGDVECRKIMGSVKTVSGDIDKKFI